MPLTVKAAIQMHWFGELYNAGDTIDTSGYDDHAMAQLLTTQPVYVSESGGSVPVYAQYLWEGGAGQVHHVYTQVPWTTDLVVGTQLFDVTDPAAPLALADGFYQLLGSCYGFPGVDSTADIFVGADWNLNGPGPFSTYATHPIGKTYPGGFGWDVPIYGEWFVRAGQVVGVAVNHADTTQTLDITTSVVVRFQPGSAPEDFPAV